MLFMLLKAGAQAPAFFYVFGEIMRRQLQIILEKPPISVTGSPRQDSPDAGSSKKDARKSTDYQLFISASICMIFSVPGAVAVHKKFPG